jgi:hypothetical protein
MFSERKNTKNRKKVARTYQHINCRVLGMGIYSISTNYCSHNSLSNGIIIPESLVPNFNISATKVGKEEQNPILGTPCGRGLTTKN